MALKVLMLRKRINDSKKALDELRSKDADFATREAEIEASIEEAQTDEERSTVEEAINNFEAEKAEHDEQKDKLERTIEELEKELKEEEEQQETPAEREDKVMQNHEERAAQATFTMRDRLANYAQRDEVKSYLGEIRSAIKEKRAITNVGLTIPAVLLGLLKENVINYSKLYRHVNVRPISGEGRQLVMGSYPEAVWTDCCGNLNELNLAFNDTEVNCWKVGGYFAICNANLEDSDVDLLSELMTALGASIGLALDKAILYGTGTRMPLGVATRLVQTAAPADYPATARAWADLHTSNIISIPANTKGTDLVAAIIVASGNSKGKYSRGEKVWVMNDTTYTNLVASMLEVDASGAIVSGVNGTMPVVGGAIEVLDFVPNNVIIEGYFDLYLLAERAGQKFATSEHVRFLQDQTVMKGTARYDGKPAIAEAFTLIGLNGVTPNAAMTFAADTANQGE